MRSRNNKTGERAGAICSHSWRKSAAACVALVLLSFSCFNSGPPPFGGGSSTIGLLQVASGFTSPVALVEPADGTRRLFIVDQVGRIHVLPAGQSATTVFLDLAARMVNIGFDVGGGLIYDERGLLGLAFHPQYAVNGRFFLFYNAPTAAGDPAFADSRVRISEFKVSASDANTADPASERILLEIVKPQFNHNGGQIAFGPDGRLYIGIGDGGGANDVDDGHTANLGNGQDKTQLLGKILRIDVDGVAPFAVPADNPFVNEAGARGEIWAMGLRNPFRFSFDRGGSRELFTGDVGQDISEEVDIVVKGGNYGWKIREGRHCFSTSSPESPAASCATTDAAGAPLIEPIIEYPHRDGSTAVGISVIGGFVYRGSAVPALAGDYVFGDFSTAFASPDGVLFAARKADDGTWQQRSLLVQGANSGQLGRYVFSFGEDQSGELYILSSANFGPTGMTGRVDKIVAATP